MGVDSRIIYPEEIRRESGCPRLDMSQRPHLPIKAALYHPPGGMIRHNAVVWGYARGAERLGAEIHTRTEVTGIDVTGTARSRESGTAAGDVIRAGVVVNSTAGYCSTIAKMAGVDLPVVTHPLQACVTEPLKPFLDVVTVSANLRRLRGTRRDRGELVLGSEIDPYSSYSQVSTLETLESIVGHSIELFPCAQERTDPAAVGWHLRHDTRLQPDNGERGRLEGLRPRRGVGYLRVQGRPRLGQEDSGAYRDREDAGADRALQALTVLRPRAREREGGGRPSRTDPDRSPGRLHPKHRSGDMDPSPPHLEPPLGVELQRLGQRFCFQLLPPQLHALQGLVLVDLERLLPDDGPFVELRCDKVRRASDDAGALLIGLLVGVGTRKCGQYGRVYVDYLVGIPPDEVGAEDAHVPCQRDVIDVVLSAVCGGTACLPFGQQSMLLTT